MSEHIVNFKESKFHKLPEKMIETAHDHVLKQALKNAYRYIDHLHERFGEPKTKSEINSLIREGMKRAKEKGKHVGRPSNKKKRSSEWDDLDEHFNEIA